MKECIKIETNSPGLFVEIDLGYICNYSCSYCAESLHTGKSWLEFDKVKQFLHKVNPTSVVLPGGEPTIYPHIIPLLKYLKDNFNAAVTITSNASKSSKWWAKYHELMDVVVFSFHIEHTNIDKFIENILAVSSNRIISINLSMVPDRFDECLAIGYKITDICPNTYVILKSLIDYKIDTLFSQYTDKQKKIMSSVLHPKVINAVNPHQIDTYKIFKDGSKEKARPHQLMCSGDINYNGWRCWKGLKFLKLLPNGDIYQSVCEITDDGTGSIGNVYDLDNVKWTTHPQICTQQECNCISSLKVIKKEKYAYL